jgi:hypothetical protein
MNSKDSKKRDEPTASWPRNYSAAETDARDECVVNPRRGSRKSICVHLRQSAVELSSLSSRQFVSIRGYFFGDLTIEIL